MPFPFDKYPWLNFQELNLAYFIKHFREIFQQWDTLLREMYDWKDATDAELAEWKSTVEEGISSWESGLQQSMEDWKDETEADISAWEAATLSALDAWKTATTAVFEQIRTEAAASATAAAGSAASAQTALAGALAAQAAAEAAAAGIQSELTQIQTNTADISDLKTQIDEIENDVLTAGYINGVYINTSIDKYQAASAERWILYPVKSGDIVYIKAPSNKTVTYSVFKEYSQPVIGETPPYATGYSGGLIAISGGHDATITIPSDGKYLVFSPNNSTVSARIITINGINVDSLYTSENLRERIVSLENDKVSNAFLEKITGNTEIEMTTGYYYPLNGTSITINEPTPYATEECALVPCSPGDSFTVSGTGGGSARPWGFVAADGTIITTSGNVGVDLTVEEVIITAPANTAYLVLNNKTSYEARSYYNAFVYERLNKLENEQNFNKFTIAEWNIGHFSNGASPVTHIDATNYDEKLVAFRQLINEVSPDVIFIPEYSAIFANVSGTQIAAANVLFQNYADSFIGSQIRYSCNAMFSNIKIEGLSDVDYECNQDAVITDPATIEATDYRYMHGTFYLGDKLVHIIGTHCAFDMNSADIETDQYDELLNLTANYEHVIIIGDMNAVHSSGEFDRFINAGFKTANHGYLGDINTYTGATNVPNKAIDNIMVKGLNITNIRTKQTDLSDHDVIFCDLSVY